MDFSEFMTTFAVCISVLFSGFLVYENERRVWLQLTASWLPNRSVPMLGGWCVEKLIA